MGSPSSIGSSFKGSVAIEVVGSGIVGVTGLSIKEGLLSAIPVIETVSSTGGGGSSAGGTSGSGTGGSGTVTVKSVFTSDSTGNPKQSFAPGDVNFNMVINNTTGQDAAASRTYYVTDPQGHVAVNTTSNTGTIPAGESTRFYTATIPSTAPAGTYTFQGTVTYNGTASTKSTTFTVAANTTTSGSPSPQNCNLVVLLASVTGGCRIRLVTPGVCEEIDLRAGQSYEFAWTTDGTYCETPYTLYVAGNPASEANTKYWTLSTDVQRGISSIGGIVNISASDLSGLTTDNGLYHWVVVGYYGSHPDSRTLRVKK